MLISSFRNWLRLLNANYSAKMLSDEWFNAINIDIEFWGFLTPAYQKDNYTLTPWYKKPRQPRRRHRLEK